MDTAETLRRNTDAALAAMQKTLSEQLYADPPDWAKPKPPTFRERLGTWKWRIVSAWDVLRGRVDPYEW